MTADKAYVAVDVTSGAAVWKEISFPTSATTLNITGIFYVNDSANSFMQTGITINGGTSDVEILAFKSDDVAHGMTAVVETDTFCEFRKAHATEGGLRVTPYATGNEGVLFLPRVTTENAPRSTAGRAPTRFDAQLKSGTTVGVMAANQNLFCISASGSTKFICDTDGDIHMDATSNINAWDEYDDVALIEAFRVLTAKPNFKQRFADQIDANAQILHKTGVITLNADGHHFVSFKGLMGLLMDAMRQLDGEVHLLKQEYAHALAARN